MMNSPLWSRLLALLLAHALALPVYAQESGGQQMRPRRVGAEPAAAAPLPVVARIAGGDENLVIRIGLATNASVATVSAAGQLLNATNESTPPVPLPAARVRLEPRLLAPLAPRRDDQYAIEIAGVATRELAERAAREIKSIAGETALISTEETSGAWRVAGRSSLTRAEADELRARLEDAAYGDVSLRQVPPPAPVGPINPAPNKAPGGVRLVAARVSAPTREIVAYSTGAASSTAAPLLRERAPVAFASDDERARPLKYNDKTYRGRIEVFANSRGTLTVVNVVKLEDYVRGVVPNELSPGSFPALEALKAQAVAARTYAVANRGQFAAQGFDLLPTTRSQVYGGAATEQALSNRAVDETRGLIATANGEPINAVYTSTCGGRTEHAENIFGGANVSYLRGRECAAEADNFAAFTVRTSREPANLRAPEHRNSARDAALLAVHGFALGARPTDDWLAANLTVEDARQLLGHVARLTRQSAVPPVTNETLRPPQWASALAAALDGESRADVLLDRADIDYLLAFRDAAEIPTANRADVAMFLRDDVLELYPDATLRSRQPLTRARALRTISRVLETRDLFALQKATTRPAAKGALVLRPRENPGGGKTPERTLALSGDGFLFRALGGSAYPVRELTIVGGEPAVYHTDARGLVDYLEVRPAPNGASADHSSQFSFWTTILTPAQVMSRLARPASSVGALVDLRVAARGSSRRAIDLEIVGTRGTAHVRGGRIRSALGLREQLFVIDRRHDDAGRVTGFVFTGRGLGHGVGMCQVGAYGLARAGWNYERILKAYYTNIELTKLY